jgi:outer membrane protein assembly factor BamD
MTALKKVFLALVIFTSITSCSDYNKVVKGDDYGKKFETANTLYDKGQFLRSITLYEQIYQRMPKTGEGELAYFRIGKAYYEEEDYYMAGYYMGAFTQRFPFSPKAQEALFLSAMCSVKNSPEESLDQTETEQAINNLQQFIDTYPNSQLIDSCNHIMDKLRFKLETKDYHAVKQYAKTENYRAAVTSALTFVEDFPRSTYKEEIYYILVKNSQLLTVNSVDDKKCERIEQTIERYRTFVTEFPNTQYKREMENIHDEMQKDFEVLCTQVKK